MRWPAARAPAPCRTAAMNMHAAEPAIDAAEPHAIGRAIQRPFRPCAVSASVPDGHRARRIAGDRQIDERGVRRLASSLRAVEEPRVGDVVGASRRRASGETRRGDSAGRRAPAPSTGARCATGRRHPTETPRGVAPARRQETAAPTCRPSAAPRSRADPAIDTPTTPVRPARTAPASPAAES